MNSTDGPGVIVLLGNAGRQYAQTRHNVAWRLTSAPALRAQRWQKKFNAEWSKVTIGEHTIVLILPQVMMNRSGESVQAAARFFRYSVGQIAVVHDDTELAFGRVSIRLGGGLAGHNGLRSVAGALSSREFWRVRIGVGRPAHGKLQAHVLGRFSPSEESELPRIIDDVLDLIDRAYREGWELAAV